MLFRSIKWLNSFPAKEGISNILSLKTILTRKLINFIKQYKIHIGAYVFIHNENNLTNTMKIQIISYIYLKSLNTYQGDHKLLNLSISKIIT